MRVLPVPVVVYPVGPVLGQATDSDVCPGAALPYLPAAQDVQTLLPAAALYEPAAQILQPLGVPLVTVAVPP